MDPPTTRIIQNQDQDAYPQSGTSSILENPKSGLEGYGWSLHLQNQDGAKIQNMGVLNISDHIRIKIKIPNPSQESPVSSQPKIRTERTWMFSASSKSRYIQNSVHGCTKVQWPYKIQDQGAKPESGTSSILQIQKSGFSGHVSTYVGCTFKIKIEPKFAPWVYQTPVNISKSRSKWQTPVRNLQRPPMPQIRT